MNDGMVLSMYDYLVLGLLTAIMGMTLLMTKKQRGVSAGMYRSYFLVGGVAAIGITAVPSYWLQALLLLMLINLLRDPMIGVHLSRAVPLYMLVLAGVVVGHAEQSLIPTILALIVGAGAVMAVQVCAELYATQALKALNAGQENVNNTQAISIVCTGAAVGLAWGFSPWWWLAVPVMALPIVLIQWYDWRKNRAVTQGPVVLACVALCGLPFVAGWWSALLLVIVIPGLIWSVGQAMRHEQWWDSGRIRCWYIALLTGWWGSGWSIRLIGRGWQSWVGYQDFLVDVAVKTKRQGLVNTKSMMSTAHNEFVQMLFEHGAIGFILLSGYVISSLWRLGHGGDEAQAVYFVALGLCGVACTLHPWTWTHGTITEVNEAGTPTKDGGGTMLYTIGSPALNWLSFLVALLMEVTR